MIMTKSNIKTNDTMQMTENTMNDASEYAAVAAPERLEQRGRARTRVEYSP